MSLCDSLSPGHRFIFWTPIPPPLKIKFLLTPSPQLIKWLLATSVCEILTSCKLSLIIYCWFNVSILVNKLVSFVSVHVWNEIHYTLTTIPLKLTCELMPNLVHILAHCQCQPGQFSSSKHTGPTQAAVYNSAYAGPSNLSVYTYTRAAHCEYTIHWQ